MGRPRAFDTEEALAQIAERFWAGGYEATGITDLVEATGVGRASLYAAFGSKQEMLHLAIDYYLDHWIEQIVSPIDDSGLDGAADMFRRMALIRETKPDRAMMGCLMVNSSVELGTSDPEVLALSDRYRKRIRSAFHSAFTRAVEDGEMEGPVDDQADLAMMLLLGIFVSIKSGADLVEIKRLTDNAVELIESWRVAPVAA